MQTPGRGGVPYFRGVELRRDEGGVLGLDMRWDTVYIGDVSPEKLREYKEQTDIALARAFVDVPTIREQTFLAEEKSLMPSPGSAKSAVLREGMPLWPTRPSHGK